jgi:hypothetical protein
VGSWGGDTDPDVDIPTYVRLWQAGRLRLERLITHEYALEDVNQALEDLEAGRLGRGLIDMRPVAVAGRRPWRQCPASGRGDVPPPRPHGGQRPSGS